MKRKIYDDLLKWKEEFDGCPLMILGARQVGKTFIINEFCKNEFKNYYHINLLENKEIIELYQTELNAEKRLQGLFLFLDGIKEDKNTILFIDEIQESEQLISDLKFICEKHSDLRLICAGSLLGVMLNRTKMSFPVGKVKRLIMYPLDFEEFLIVKNKEKLIDEIKKSYEQRKKMSDFYHKMALDMYREYLIIGGMPKAVSNYIESKSINDYLNNYNYIETLLNDYFNDMSKYVFNKSEMVRIKEVYKSIPMELGNKSKKFQATKINKDARMKDYTLPIEWLIESNIVLRNDCINCPNVPIKSEVINDVFKLYYSDISFLIHMLEVPYELIYLDKDYIFKGIITENYVANILKINGFSLYYWKNSEFEIDFVIQDGINAIPVEVKTADNTKSKSLKSYMSKYNPSYAIRISTKNFGFVDNIFSIPLYAVFCLKPEKVKLK